MVPLSSPRADARRPGWLLVVDDDAPLAALLARYMRRAIPAEALAEARAASAPDEALDALVSAPVDAPTVVLCDFDLRSADADGLDVLAEVGRRLPHARRVLVSGRAEEEIGPALAGARLDAFVPKPVAMQHARDLVLRLLAQ